MRPGLLPIELPWSEWAALVTLLRVAAGPRAVLPPGYCEGIAQSSGRKEVVMRRLVVVVLLAALAAGGAYCWVNYEVEIRRGQEGLDSITIRPKQAGSTPGRTAEGSAEADVPRVVRIATFNLDGLGERKLAQQPTAAVLADVISRFDVVAVQAVQQGALLRLVDQVNAGGRQYDYASGADAAGQSGGFLFDRSSIEIDRSTVQSVADPGGRLRHQPLVALFRVRGPDPAEAFTFKLINVQTDPGGAAPDRELFDEVYRAVRDDQPDEDDLILLGGVGEAGGMGQSGETLWLSSSISETPTTLGGTLPADNILFDARATAEFTGRSGVLDLMREFDLTWREASEVSDHLPVWAEFSSHEGGELVRVAGSHDRTER
jgi:deoxyribonuclease-1-like protein